MVSKRQIAFESKAQADKSRVSQHTFKYVSILKRSVMLFSLIELARIPLCGATQLSDARWGFETISSAIWRPPRSSKVCGPVRMIGFHNKGSRRRYQALDSI